MAIAALVGIVLLLAEAAITILLLVFAGILLAIYLRSLADLLSAHTPLGPRVSLLAVILLHVMVLIALGVYAVPALDAQIGELSEKLPAALERLEDNLRTTSWGRWLLTKVPDLSSVADSSGGGWLSRITGIVSRAVTVIVSFLVIGFIGLYGASEPHVYRRGLLMLVPKSHRERVGEVLTRVVHALRWWILARIVSATIIGVASTLGLWIIGVPLPVLMGLIAAVLTFIPNIGPTIALAPPALLALLDSPQKALIVVVYYLAVQLLESYVITPLLERRAIHAPPALLLTTQALFGVLTGIVGIALADPLLAMTLVLVQSFHVEDVVGEETRASEM